MQPWLTAAPIEPGSLVPWMAIGPPCGQFRERRRERGDAERRRPERAPLRTGGMSDLVDVEAADRRRRAPARRSPARVVSCTRPERRAAGGASDRSTSMRVVTEASLRAPRRDPARCAPFGRSGQLDEIPRGAAARVDHARAHPEQRREVVLRSRCRTARATGPPGSSRAASGSPATATTAAPLAAHALDGSAPGSRSPAAGCARGSRGRGRDHQPRRRGTQTGHKRSQISDNSLRTPTSYLS